ncbi:hypothetical protein V1506DRAFT_549683 [Lipomyces tetrasporus]
MVLMADDSLPDYKALWEQAEESIRHTTFEQFIRACHNLLSLQVEVGDKSLSTKGSLTKPTGRLCPQRLRNWADCLDSQQQLYNSVRKFLHASEEDAPRLFSSVHSLENLGRNHCSRPLRSGVIAELCKISDAREEFKLEDGVQFDNHANALTDAESDKPDVKDQSSVRHPVPDIFFYRVKGNTNTLFTTGEYKPPHKLSVESLRAGLRPMDFYEKVVQVVKIPPRDEKLRYNAEQLTGSALVQQYDVMIRKGLEYSYITNGLALVLLHVCYDDPSTLYYCLCEPNREPRTAVSRVLCLCLMSLRSRTRKQRWRNRAIRQLHTWKTDLDYVWAQIPEDERHQTPPSSESQSEYQVSSISESPQPDGHRPITRSQTGCRPQETMHRSESMDSSDSDPNQASSGRKRPLNLITSLPPSRRRSRQIGSQSGQVSRRQHHTVKFCTQRCLLGLQQGGILDSRCPNVELHRQGRDTDRHLISSERLVQLLKQQLDEDLDHNCTPFGACGAYGAPFKITCVPYGYTVVGKGTTAGLWNEVSREVDVYRILHRAQGSAVPVFLGAIDLELIYFHDAGDIRHMLLMAWGGKDTTELEHSQELLHEINRSKREIRALGVVHGDFRFGNVLWNEELGRALIIDFHRSKLAPRLIEKRKALRQSLYETQISEAKRLHAA